MAANKQRSLFLAWLGIYFLSIFLLVAFHPFESSAAIYRWIDVSGTVHLSDSLDDIPPSYLHSFRVITEPQERGSGDVIPFERTASGLVLVNAILNDGVKVKMVLDTGANLVVLTEAVSKKLRQDLTSGDETIKLYTNCGEVEGKSFVINKIELGNARKENVRAVITPNDYSLSGFDGLLGLSFLGDFKVTVDYQNEKIIIGK
ncbi:MAG TPA: retroviral-like aspartic protease family protein [Syntrophales bacterium]|nr:retroviral-like aspartic protease family protein [Syntrophales bacterium]